MHALGRFSIRTRLYFGTVFSLILLVLIGAMGYVALDRTRGTLQVLDWLVAKVQQESKAHAPAAEAKPAASKAASAKGK